MRRLSLAILAAGLLCTPALAADDYPRNWDVDVTHYAFHLTLSDDSNEIVGETDVTVRFVAAGIVEFALDLIGKDASGETGMAVESVSRDGEPVTFAHSDDRLRISMTTPSAAGEKRTFTVAYRGVPGDGLVIDENMYGDRTFFGDSYPDRARHWIPTVDHVSDKATTEWIIVAPAHYQVVASGLIAEKTDLADGNRLTHWRSTVPISPKVMVIGVARFAVENVAVVRGIPVQSWVYPQNRDAGFYDYAMAEKVLRFFDGHIGPYPYAKLANVQSKTRWGGMENASNIFYSERSVSGTRGSEGLIAHEIAHQWFGDSVTERDWHHLWLSEGFATYFTQIYMEFNYGRDRLAEGMQGARQSVINYYADNPGQALIALELTNPRDMLNGNAYRKGAWLLHMLRRQVGDNAFWTGIRGYYREFRDQTALTEDFQRVMEEASGQDLEWFFSQWAYVAGHPTLEATWSHTAGRLEVIVRQTHAAGNVFRFPLDIGIESASGVPPRVETVEMTGPQQTFTFEVATAPAALVLDPDTWLLFEGTVSARRDDGRTEPG